MRDGKGPSEKVMGRVSRVPLRVVIPIGVALLVVMMIVSVGTGPVGLGVGAIMRVIVHEVLGVGQPQPQLDEVLLQRLAPMRQRLVLRLRPMMARGCR